MICNVEINDKNLKEALYTLFGKTALDDLIKETVNQDLEYITENKNNSNVGVFVDLDDIKTNLYNLQIVGDKLFIPTKHLDIFPISETEWNPYPKIIPECNEKKEWLVQNEQGHICIAKFYGGLQGKYFYPMGNVYKLDNVVAFHSLPEKYNDKSR